MNIFLVDAKDEDYQEYYNLVTLPKIQKEFSGLRSITIDGAKNEMNFWANYKIGSSNNLFKLIKVSNETDYSKLNTKNSELIGFIVNTKVSINDCSNTGYNWLLSFALKSRYENNGLMTIALKLFLEIMYNIGYTFATSFVRHGNESSQKVLEKCGFDLARENFRGKTFIKSLNISNEFYKKILTQ